MWRAASVTPTQVRTPDYRASIDGLRAIAVMAVIFYHAKVPGFRGGFAGVDVFFVISGFLITQWLDVSRDLPPARLLAQFFLRRARRLLPALFTMLVVGTAVATVVYLPADLRNYGRDLTLAVVFLGNIGAWLHGGYFAAAERFAPLRHLWSIAVEEQFYLLYPLCLMAVARYFGQWRGLILAAAALLSLLLAYVAAVHWPVLNYFMLPTRAWELLLGAVIAVWPALLHRGGRLREMLAAVSLVGLMVIFWGAATPDFPGPANLAACICTGLLIIGSAPGSSYLGRVLSCRPLVATGLISYSLYLWHTPVLAFYGYYNIREPGGVETGILLIAIYLVALLSWVAVEQPFRSGRLSRAPAPFVVSMMAACALLTVAGQFLLHTDGLPGRFGPSVLATQAAAQSAPVIPADCVHRPLAMVAAGDLCSFGPQNDSVPRVVVWGDSHAFALLPAYDALAKVDHLRIYFATTGACWPLPGAERGPAGNYWHEGCLRFNSAMASGIRRLHPQRVILNAYWGDTEPGAEPVARSQPLQAGADSAMYGNAVRALEQMRSPGMSVCLMLTVPGYSYPIPYALAMAERRRISEATLSISRTQALREYEPVENVLRRLAARQELTLVDPKDTFCPTDRCLLRGADGSILYRDISHLSVAGAMTLTGQLEHCLANLH
jgi:peptidoglycan/LPS O-acetylase OafA/YrhL